MSSKPTVLARWATAPLAGGVITPSSGKQDRGFVPGERPPAQYLNWLLVNTYLWVKWLDDGDVAFTTVAVSGLTSANGGITVPTGKTVTLNGTTTLTVGTGAVTFGGLLNANAGITVATGQAVTLSGTATLTVGGTSTQAAITASGLITANAGVTAGANQHITVSGTGKFKHPTVTDTISPFDAFPGNVNSPVVSMSGSGEVMLLNGAAVGAFCVIPLRLRIGWQVTAIRCRVQDTSPNKVAIVVASIVDAVSTLVMSGGLSAGTGAWQTVTLSTPFTVVAGTGYHIRLALSTGATAIACNHIEIDYNQP